MKTVITFGTFDLFHVGHLNILRRSAQLGDRLVVGISSDEFTFQKKTRNSFITMPVMIKQYTYKIHKSFLYGII